MALVDYSPADVIPTWTWWSEDMTVAPWDKPIQTLTSTAQLINNLPEDCSRLIYRCVMNNIIRRIPDLALGYYDKIYNHNKAEFNEIHDRRYSLNARSHNVKKVGLMEMKLNMLDYRLMEVTRVKDNAHQMRNEILLLKNKKTI